MDPSTAPEAARAWIESFGGMRPDELRRGGWMGFDSFHDSLVLNAEAFPAFIEALRHGPGDTRAILAGRALRHAGGRAVPSLMAVLERGDAVSRREAAELLGRIGSQDPAVREALRRGMDDPDAEFRDRCAFALAGMDPSDVLAASRMLEWLRSEEPARRLAAAIHFGRREARDRAAIPGLIALLEGPDGGTRRTAAEALGGFGEEAAEAVPAFARLLKDPSRRGDEGDHLAWAFLALGPAIVPSLLDFVEHGDEELRGIGFQLLRNLGERGESALGKMETLLGGGDAVLRESAAATIPFLGSKGLAAAMKALANESAKVRLAMAEGVAKEGQRGWESLAPALAEAASKDVDRDVRRAALGAAVVVGGKDPTVRYAVVRALRDPDPQIRREALEHVPYFDFSAETAAALVSLLGSADEEERGGALQLLARCDCTPDDAIPRLLGFFSDPNANARACAAEALGRMGTRASRAAQALRAACQDPEEIVRSEARKALNRVEGKTVPR
jgi:HEAT repeat protein